MKYLPPTLLALLYSCVLSASGNLLINPSFEANGPDAIGRGTTQITGWRIESGNVDIMEGLHNAAPDGKGRLAMPSDGKMIIDLAGDRSATISQSIFGLTPGATYTLTFYYEINNAAESRRKVSLFSWELTGGLEGKGDLRAKDNHPSYEMSKFSMDFVATGPEAVLRFQDKSLLENPQGNPRNGVLLDHVSLVKTQDMVSTQTLPEDNAPLEEESGESVYQFKFGIAGWIPSTGDFDGDRTTDFALYNPNNGNWAFATSSLGIYTLRAENFAPAPITGDFDGDRISDFGSYHPQSSFWILQQSTEGLLKFDFDLEGFLPVTGDFNQDGYDELGLYYPSTGDWEMNNREQHSHILMLSETDHLPVTGDFDADGVVDAGLFNPLLGTWHLSQSFAGQKYFLFGDPNVYPVTGDFNGDGITDLGTYNPETLIWTLFFLSNDQ